MILIAENWANFVAEFYKACFANKSLFITFIEKKFKKESFIKLLTDFPSI